ncbi:hypothetical protein [Paracoccus sp. N5]|uniref:hypothetical protein n=1 Tax=Paracoccus sp. N5 TaxID=1101189 RepID=UPI00036D4AF4|nr:hypothetical protein [Paracoccus sp. N5]
MNGRFYGPWWQGLSSGLREQIFINDTPAVEIDFKAMHIQILAAQKGWSFLLTPMNFRRGNSRILILPSSVPWSSN